ncbi:DUF2771 family protein [Gordonia hydrophobica]|uniref:DUF2771 family protein n=1 Tax=Gordonia hydrophobica TaxID=40516 RepID=A0ABZ2U3J3_9ACTN|nr:DUF2771 family protein [Gordonia hydrophobica]MBM7367493.1 hypothetical protein [Gordonia hydrophobica]
MLQPGDKKALTIIGAVVVAALVIIAGATALLVRGHEKPVPALSFQAGDHLSRVEPSFWCSAKMDECTGVVSNTGNVRVVDHPVPVGSTAMLSVPAEVSGSPWTLLAEYATPRGLLRVQWVHLPDTKYTQVLKSTPNRVLIGAEVSVISAVQVPIPGQPANAEGGDLLLRGVYSIRTLPIGFEVRNQTPLAGERGN